MTYQVYHEPPGDPLAYRFRRSSANSASPVPVTIIVAGSGASVNVPSRIPPV